MARTATTMAGSRTALAVVSSIMMECKSWL